METFFNLPFHLKIIFQVFRLLRSLRPLRVINRAPGLKLVVQTLLSSLRPIGNIVLICCTFFIIFGILGVQLFKGTFFYCEGEDIKSVKNKTDCLSNPHNVWINRKYNFDDLGKALMSLFVLSSRDGWVNIMYTGLDAVGVDQQVLSIYDLNNNYFLIKFSIFEFSKFSQPVVNFNEWRLLYFIAFILLVGFFVLNMFVGVVVENFHRCREEQEKEEKIRRAAKRALQMEKKRRRMHEPPYYTNYSPLRLFVHNVVTSKYFDLAIAAVIGLNVVTMAMEYYKMPLALEYALKIFNYFFTAVFILEAIMKLVALGFKIYLKDKWNQLDVGIVILSIVGIVLEELETNIIPINPTIIRVMRVLRIARVLKLLKMAKGIRALLDTVMQALPQVGNLGLLFFLLFFIFAALGVELFGRLECSDEMPCQGLGEHAHFANFGMAFLTLFRVATGDNWNGIMKDTLRDDCDDAADCVKNCCVSTVIAPIFFVIFVLMAQFVLVNVVVAVLMKHLEESHKQMEDEADIDTELEREFAIAQEFEEEQAMCMQLEDEASKLQKRPLTKVSSLPSNFTYSTPILERKYNLNQRRQTVQYFNQPLSVLNSYTNTSSYDETAENNIDNIDSNLNDDLVNKLILNTPSAALGGNTKRLNKSTFKRSLFEKRSVSIEESKMSSYYNDCGVGGTSGSGSGMGSSCVGGVGRRQSTKFDRKPNFDIKIDMFMMDGKDRDRDKESDDKLLISTVGSTKNLMKNINIPTTTVTPTSTTNIFPLTVTSPPTTVSIKTIKDDLPRQTSLDCYGNNERKKNLLDIGQSLSVGGVGSLPGPSGSSNKLFLSVPRLQSSRSRSGSTKQLFKQAALDEDNEESSLLLPVVNTNDNLIEDKSIDGNTSTLSLSDVIDIEDDVNLNDNIKKSESCEIIRIISERRKV